MTGATTLHLLFASPLSGPCFEQCRRAMLPGDALLLIGDGSFALLPGSAATAALAEIASHTGVHALAEDCEARGVHAAPDWLRRIDYAGFVALSCTHARSMSWF